MTKLLVTARRRAYGGSGQGSSGLYSHGTNSSARHTYGNLVRGGSSGRQKASGYTSRYGNSYQRPQSAQGGAYRLARARKQQQNSDAYQKALQHQQQTSQQKMRVAGSAASRQGVTGTGTHFQTNYWGGTQQAKNEVAHHHPLLQQNKHAQPYDGLNKRTSDRWNQRGSSNKDIKKGNTGVTTTTRKKTTTSPQMLKTSKDSVSRTLSVSSQNNRSNPNAPLIKLTPRSSAQKIAADGKAAAAGAGANKSATATTSTSKKVTATDNTATNNKEMKATTSASSGGGKVTSSGTDETAKAATSVASAVADEAEIAATALIGGDSSLTNKSGKNKPPSDFAKMREANRLLAERNLKLREELELLRHQQQNDSEDGSEGGAATTAGKVSGTTTAAGSAGTSSAAGATAKKAATKKVTNTTTKKATTVSNGNNKSTTKASGGVDWWDKNYAMQGKSAKRPVQRPQSAGRVKSDRAGTGTGGGTNAAAYMNTLRPQRRPGSAGRTRDTSSSSSSSKGGKKKIQRPTTAPGRRREDQAAAHGMSDQMVDAASEEVRLRALMNDVNWDGRGRSDMYHFGKVLGTGSFGVVRLVHHKLSGTKTAVKTYDKRKIKDSAQLKRVQQEIRLMARANHPNIVRLFETLESQHRVHLVMEYVAGGNLCQYVKLKKKLTESEARLIFQQLSHASAYLHSINVAHRDIKLENVLFGPDKIAKLTDFGFSVYTKDHRLKVFCGTPSYMAPEIVMRREYYGFPVDVWSLGVLLYAMLCGCFPFTANSYPNLYKKIAVGQFSMPKNLSQNVRDVLRRMLCVNPPKRITMNQVRRHQWTVSGEIYVPLKANEAPLLVADNPSDDLQNNDVVMHMQALGFRRGSIVESVLGRKKNHITTCFYLLCDKIGMPKKTSGASGLASSAPAPMSGAQAGAQAGKAGAKEAAIASSSAKNVTRPSTAGSSRPSTAGSSRNSASARTSGFKRPASASRSRGR